MYVSLLCYYFLSEGFSHLNGRTKYLFVHQKESIIRFIVVQFLSFTSLQTNGNVIQNQVQSWLHSSLFLPYKGMGFLFVDIIAELENNYVKRVNEITEKEDEIGGFLNFAKKEEKGQV